MEQVLHFFTAFYFWPSTGNLSEPSFLGENRIGSAHSVSYWAITFISSVLSIPDFRICFSFFFAQYGAQYTRFFGPVIDSIRCLALLRRFRWPFTLFRGLPSCSEIYHDMWTIYRRYVLLVASLSSFSFHLSRPVLPVAQFSSIDPLVLHSGSVLSLFLTPGPARHLRLYDYCFWQLITGDNQHVLGECYPSSCTGGYLH